MLLLLLRLEAATCGAVTHAGMSSEQTQKGRDKGGGCHALLPPHMMALTSTRRVQGNFLASYRSRLL